MSYDPNRTKRFVFIHVTSSNDVRFDMLLTRVPCVGEELNREDRSYKVTRVQHEPCDHQGYVRLGWHAFVDVDLLAEESPLPRKRNKKLIKNSSLGSKRRQNRRPGPGRS